MATKSSFPMWGALLITCLVGVLVALQSRINGQLSVELGYNGFLAAAISFTGGLIVISLVLAASRPGQRGLTKLFGLVRAGRFPWWGIMGGSAGAFFVIAQSTSASVVGVALFTVGIVAGQILGGMFFDLRGLGPSGVVRPSVFRVVGAALSVVGVVVAAWAGLAQGAHLLLLVLPVLAGLGVAWQSAVNGISRSASGSAVTATFLNFLVGAVLLIVAALVWSAVAGWPQQFPSEWWLYSGGLIGCIFIASIALLVRVAGVLLVGMASVAGQLLGAVFFDLVVPVAGGVTASMLVGAGIALVGVGVAALRKREG